MRHSFTKESSLNSGGKEKALQQSEKLCKAWIAWEMWEDKENFLQNQKFSDQLILLLYKFHPDIKKNPEKNM